MYLYRQRKHILYNLHPASPALLTMVLVILSFTLSHPLLLLALLAAVLLDLWAAGLIIEARSYLLVGFTMAIFIILVNLIFSRNGNTVLWGINLPLIGQIDFTLEVLVFSLTMSVRLLIILEAFCLFTYLVNPDQIVKFLSRWSGNTALALAITLRLLPTLVSKFKSIKEIQACRGVNWENTDIRSRLQQLRPLILALLAESLEDSMQLAQSLQTRGFGAGKRLVYDTSFWSLNDTLMTVFILAGLALGLAVTVTGQGGFAFYPQLSELLRRDMIYAAGSLLLLFTYPAMLSGGYYLWRSLKLTT